MYNILQDHLGLCNVITDESGNKVEELSFDPWGRRRNPSNCSYTGVTTPTLFTRRFTGHEHLNDFALINMPACRSICEGWNGSLYDPYLGRFLSADNYVQNALSTQSYDRYSYCLNNPLIYTDPSGEWLWIPFAIIGAYLGGVAANEGELNPGQWENELSTYCGVIAGGIFGAVAGYSLTNPSDVSWQFGIGTPVAGIYLVGQNSDWSFQWTTSAGGGGEINLTNPSEVKSPEQITNEGINKALNNYYLGEQSFEEFKNEYWASRTSFNTGELRRGDLAVWFLGEYALTGNEEYLFEFFKESNYDLQAHFNSIDERIISVYPEAYFFGAFKLRGLANHNNWLRIGWSTDRGKDVYRIAWGAAPYHANKIKYTYLKKLNQWLRKLGGGHLDLIRN